MVKVKDELPIDKDIVKKMIEKFESRNGNRIADFSIKEIVLLLHKDQKKEISKINHKLDKQFSSIAEHDKIMAHIMEALPEKGFCERVTNVLFPENDIPLSKKIELMWNDRRWVKYLAGGMVGAILIGIGNIAIQVMLNG
jgi:hypothetical protein